jgi:hypothetical protein|tara:strand:+ start:464 stop:769 length:306 start_codon:yes stop_codon:yes gene_type:complete
MPRKKKKNTTKKKKAEVRFSREIITEWEDWKSGDVAWGTTFASKKSVYGEIKEFYPEDKHGPAVTLLDAIDGAYVTILVSTLSDKDPKKIKIKRSKKTSKV